MPEIIIGRHVVLTTNVGSGGVAGTEGVLINEREGGTIRVTKALKDGEVGWLEERWGEGRYLHTFGHFEYPKDQMCLK